MAEAHEIVFAEAIRLIARQEADFDTLRVRSLGVLTATGLIAGLVGIKEHGQSTGWSLTALLLIAFIAAIGVWIQWPADFDFSHDVGPMIDRVRDAHKEPLESVDVTYNWARELDENRKRNAAKLRKRYQGFTYMCVGLAAEVLLLVAAAGP